MMPRDKIELPTRRFSDQIFENLKIQNLGLIRLLDLILRGFYHPEEAVN
jgi:hypothetical protein